jgi:hypothetical protein
MPVMNIIKKEEKTARRFLDRIALLVYMERQKYLKYQ